VFLPSRGPFAPASPAAPSRARAVLASCPFVRTTGPPSSHVSRSPQRPKVKRQDAGSRPCRPRQTPGSCGTRRRAAVAGQIPYHPGFPCGSRHGEDPHSHVKPPAGIFSTRQAIVRGGLLPGCVDMAASAATARPSAAMSPCAVRQKSIRRLRQMQNRYIGRRPCRPLEKRSPGWLQANRAAPATPVKPGDAAFAPPLKTFRSPPCRRTPQGCAPLGLCLQAHGRRHPGSHPGISNHYDFSGDESRTGTTSPSAFAIRPGRQAVPAGSPARVPGRTPPKFQLL